MATLKLTVADHERVREINTSVRTAMAMLQTVLRQCAAIADQIDPPSDPITDDSGVVNLSDLIHKADDQSARVLYGLIGKLAEWEGERA
jgi:hypothetical protein